MVQIAISFKENFVDCSENNATNENYKIKFSWKALYTKLLCEKRLAKCCGEFSNQCSLCILIWAYAPIFGNDI